MKWVCGMSIDRVDEGGTDNGANIKQLDLCSRGSPLLTSNSNVIATPSVLKCKRDSRVPHPFFLLVPVSYGSLA